MSDASMNLEPSTDWLVVCNDEGRYSVWPAGLPVPLGWSTTGLRGGRSDCLAWIAENWADPRPAGVGREPQ
jgi:MbtH protein